jgi:hypothetical protein
MISQTGGISAYNSIEQLVRPQDRAQPPTPEQTQQNAQGGNTVADKTDISAAALALSKNSQQTGATAEQQEPKTAEQGETREETSRTQQTAPPPPPPPQQQQVQQAQQQQNQSASINIRV